MNNQNIMSGKMILLRFFPEFNVDRNQLESAGSIDRHCAQCYQKA